MSDLHPLEEIEGLSADRFEKLKRLQISAVEDLLARWSDLEERRFLASDLDMSLAELDALCEREKQRIGWEPKLSGHGTGAW